MAADLDATQHSMSAVKNVDSDPRIEGDSDDDSLTKISRF
jgi:hypothetical protein